MTQSNNVVEFPKHKIVRDPSLNTEEAKALKAKRLELFADTLTEEVTENILADLANSDIDIENDIFVKDFHFLVGVLTAVVYRAMSLEHELHDFIDKRVKIVSSEDVQINGLDSIDFNKLVEELDKID